MAGPERDALAQPAIRRAVPRGRGRARSGQTGGAVHRDERHGGRRSGGDPGRVSPARCGSGQDAESLAERMGQRLLGSERLVSEDMRALPAAAFSPRERRTGDPAGGRHPAGPGAAGGVRSCAMTRYLLRRLAIAIPSLLGISLVLFTVLALAPGDPFSELATNPDVPASVAAHLRAQFGLDDPIWLRYLHWLAAMLHGEWGFSFASRVAVSRLILQRLPTTLWVIGLSQVLALLVALPVGVLSAIRPYSIFDQIASTLALIGFSLPTFFTGLLFILVFSIHLGWLPFVYRVDLNAAGWRWYWEECRQALMPVAVLGLFQGASWTRYVRAAVLDAVRLEHVTTARAKGLPEPVVIVKHVVRNALTPVVTMVALQMPTLFGGAIVTEQIFRVPGIGSLLISAILANDTPVVMAVSFVFACLVILFNLVADLLYVWLDPRIAYR